VGSDIEDDVEVLPSHTEESVVPNSTLTRSEGRIRQRRVNTGERLLKCVEEMAAASRVEVVPEVSVIRKAVMKLRGEYRGKPGWNTEDLVMGYQLLENPAKADVFMGMDGGEDQDEWLRYQLRRERHVL